MKLLQAIDNYVTLKRSLGAVYTSTHKILRSFAKLVGDIPIEEINAEQCRQFCYADGAATKRSVDKHHTVRRFFRHLVARGHLTSSPAEEPTRRLVSTFLPHIYTRNELERLLDAALRLANRFGFDGYTLRTLLLLLYATGLRVGEALALRCCDIEVSQQVLTVWRSKFFKSRLVPFGQDLARALKAYRDRRNTFPLADGERSAFFATRAGKPIHLGRVEAAFDRIRKEEGIHRPDTDSHNPRIHDLRATFAVHQLVSWYREGINVQERLPFLATYLGHTSLSGTQVYLRMTSELLIEASRLFEMYASVMKEVGDEREASLRAFRP
jgi:integrase/recombinase XerD